MQSKLAEITFNIELKPGEPLTIPSDAAAIVGPGHWLVSIRPADSSPSGGAIRSHSGFLKSYAPEDEGLYDDYSAG
jgi:hypothetical protein